MAQLITFEDGVDRIVAEENEVLEFVNKIRIAGGADVIDALFPSVKSDAQACLIARALNFNCSVNGASFSTRAQWIKEYPDFIDRVQTVWASDNYAAYKGTVHDNEQGDQTGDSVWVMVIQHGNIEASIDKAKEIADALDLPRVDNEIYLEPAIANAAYAFDSGLAFQEFVVTHTEFLELDD